MTDSLKKIELEPSHPICIISESLSDMLESIVFIGGAIAPILQTHPPFPVARPTKDVDAVIATINYSDLSEINRKLHELHFRHDTSQTSHVHRWIDSNGIMFDLIPVGHHAGTSGNRWDSLAIETADSGRLSSGKIIRFASSAGFLGLKWSAYKDRGAQDPYGSHDIEDILALIASRPNIVEEIYSAPVELVSFIRDSTKAFLELKVAEDVISGALANIRDGNIITMVKERINRIANRTDL